MCQSCDEGGRQCRDSRSLKTLTLADLAPESPAEIPTVDWATHDFQETVESLWSHFPPAVAAEAVAVIAEAREAEATTTAAIIESLPTGARAHGLNFRMKSPESLARKLHSKAKKGVVNLAPAEVMRRVSDTLTDVLRYTAVAADHNDIASTMRAMVRSLKTQGFNVVSAESTYVDGNPYKGLHLLMQRGDERPIELQVHSELSQRIKDQNHVDYEIARELQTPPAEVIAAQLRMVTRSAGIPSPAGLAVLKTIGGCSLVVKKYPAPYPQADNRSEEAQNDGVLRR